MNGSEIKEKSIWKRTNKFVYMKIFRPITSWNGRIDDDLLRIESGK